MSFLLIWVVITVVALCALIWLLGHLRKARVQREPTNTEINAVAQSVAEQAPTSQDVNFRMRGERGMGGPVYGDLMCADGVYLPHVWETDFYVSLDGRWLRTGLYEADSGCLIDRQSRRSWSLSAREDELVDGAHSRLPRWSGESVNVNESGMAVDEHDVLSDARFEAWLGQNISSPARALVAVRDIWAPEHCLTPQAGEQPPTLPKPPVIEKEVLPATTELAARSKPQSPQSAPLQLTLERHWPESLRNLPDPLGPLNRPNWQLLINGVAQPWALDESHNLVWRDDGQAFALYAYADGLALVAWSAEHGWQQWDEWVPADRKSWSVNLYFPPESEEGEAKAAGLPVLVWEGRVVLQRVEVDTPALERLHDGTSLSCVISSIEGCAGYGKNGQVQLKTIPSSNFVWLRDPAQPLQWQARSEPVRGQCLLWSLSKPAQDEQGETAAYSLQWGERHLPGVWALEHVVVQGRCAVLMPHGKSPMRGGSGTLQTWDGERLQNVDLPWPVLRMIPVPGSGTHAVAERVRVVALTGCVADKDWDANVAAWRWQQHSASSSHLERDDWRAVYSMHEIAPDAQGSWHLQPRWREVRQIQHPCADGDYVWRDEACGDALWWWGGLHENVNNYWDVHAPRFEGVTVMRSGTVLCGTGPSACPHPAGEGWAVLEFVSSSYTGPSQWKLHWLNPVEKDVRSLEFQAWMPLLGGWDAQGLHWRETGQSGEGEAAPKEGKAQTITQQMWNCVEVEKLRQGKQGLWLRKQDLRYVEALFAQDDWPWQRQGQ